MMNFSSSNTRDAAMKLAVEIDDNDTTRLDAATIEWVSQAAQAHAGSPLLIDMLNDDKVGAPIRTRAMNVLTAQILANA